MKRQAGRRRTPEHCSLHLAVQQFFAFDKTIVSGVMSSDVSVVAMQELRLFEHVDEAQWQLHTAVSQEIAQTGHVTFATTF